MIETLFLILRLVVSILAALIAGKLVSKLRLPGILGFLVVGMIFGPYALNIISTDLTTSSWYGTLTHLMELCVGLMFGKDLIIRKMKSYGKQIMVLTLFESLGTFVVVTAFFAIVFSFMNIPLYVAVIFGGIALATAPAPALSIVTEFKTKGELTQSLIPIAILDDVIALTVFFTINALVGSMGSAVVTSPAVAVLLSIGLPVLIGVILGFASSKIYKKITADKLLLPVTIALIVLIYLVSYGIDTYVLPTPSINYLMLSLAFFATITNLVSEETMTKISNSFKGITSIAFVIMILNLAAPLDYHLIFGAGVLTFVYIISRGCGKYFCTRLGGMVLGASDNIKKYLGLTFLPHSGVSLVFTGMAVTTLNTFDTDSALIVQGTIAAAAVINEIFAVIIAKKGFELSGEIEQTKTKK